MDNLPLEVIRKIYSYDNTYKIKFGKVLTQLIAHSFIYKCRICFKPYNNCCYCAVCETYLKLCQQIYYDEMSTYEGEIKMITALGFLFKYSFLFKIYVCNI